MIPIDLYFMFVAPLLLFAWGMAIYYMAARDADRP